jgi:putative membrane protein
MDTSIEEKLVADLRDDLAQERTFLAWIRTGIALTGFGLVVAQFDLFDQPRIAPPMTAMHPHGPSLWFGTALVAIGVAVNLFSAWRYTRLVGRLSREHFVRRSVSKQGVFVALFMAILGIAMTLYLISASWQPGLLHAQSALYSAAS